jgi:hypothetical protein
METIAIALVSGLIGGAAVAVIGGLITLVVQGREHRARAAEVAAGQDHEKAMARERRLQERRAGAYERMLEHIYRLDTWVERTEPLIGPAANPPAMLADEELFKLNAITAAHASPDSAGRQGEADNARSGGGDAMARANRGARRVP